MSALFSAEENDNKDAKAIYDFFKDLCLRLLLIFLDLILSQIRKLNDQLQSNEADNISIFEELQTYFRLLASRVLNPAILCRNTDVQLCFLSPESHFVFLHDDHVDYSGNFIKAVASSSLKSEEKRAIRHTAVKFLRALFIAFQCWLLALMELFLQTSSFKLPTFMEKKIQPSLLKKPFFEADISELENQVCDIQACMWRAKTTEDFWVEVFHHKNLLSETSYYPLAEDVLKMMALPTSNADVERVFSQMNVKTKLRNRMLPVTLNALLHCRYGLHLTGKLIHEFEPTNNMLKQFTSSTYK